MEKEYSQTVPNMRVVIHDVTIPQALDYKKKLEQVDGVDEVNWLDDVVDIYEPLENADQDTIDEWYKDSDALYSITVVDDETEKKAAVDEIRDIIGDDNSMSGTAVTDALSPFHTSSDIQKIMLFVLSVTFIVLLLTTNLWFEPVLFMITIGIAIMLNRGTNLMFGEISFVTNAAGSVLQLAVSMDYSIFLLHRFAENRAEGKDVQDAMVAAVKQSTGSVLSSGLTTVIGFAALILMRFKIGPDMGWVMAKAIVFSLLCVLCFLPALLMLFDRVIEKTTAIALSAVLGVGSVLPVLAADTDLLKDENVYVTLMEDGTVSDVYVVNEFTSTSDSEVTDYGKYSSVKNLTTDSEITQNGDQVSVDVTKGKFYYQGNLETKDIPWNISIATNWTEHRSRLPNWQERADIWRSRSKQARIKTATALSSRTIFFRQPSS